MPRTQPMTLREAERALELRNQGASYAQIASRLHRSRKAIIKLLRTERKPRCGDARFRCPECGGLSILEICAPCELRSQRQTVINRTTAAEWFNRTAQMAWKELHGDG